MDKTIIKNLENYFESNSDQQACMVTNDGCIFRTFDRSIAIAHAHMLKVGNGHVLYVSRGTNFEDWYCEFSGKPEWHLRQELGKKKIPNRKWGWWNWLYKILH